MTSPNPLGVNEPSPPASRGESPSGEAMSSRSVHAHARRCWGVSGAPDVLTKVDVDLHAFHTDPHMGEGRHDHVWNVQLVYDGEVFRDARCFRVALTQFLAPYQGKDLPEAWWAAEDLARAVLCIGTGDPIGCIVTRPGFAAEAWR